MERVTIREGSSPIIIFAPHAFDGNDTNTGIIAKSMAKELDAFAVINNGWERSNSVDCFNDKADCNNTKHCHEDVVKEEVLDPILKFVRKIKKQHGSAYIYNIHGMSDRHRDIAKEKIDIVIGFGDGDPPSHTIDLWRKNFFVSRLNRLGINAFEGKAGGQMSGWNKNNMNQIFRKWYLDHMVHSLQIEITYELRSDTTMALVTSDYLATCAKELLGLSSFSCTDVFKKY